MTIEESEKPTIDRRSFIGKAGLGVAGFAASAAVLAACSTTEVADTDADPAGPDSDSDGDETTAATTGDDSETVTDVAVVPTLFLEWCLPPNAVPNAAGQSQLKNLQPRSNSPRTMSRRVRWVVTSPTLNGALVNNYDKQLWL